MSNLCAEHDLVLLLSRLNVPEGLDDRINEAFLGRFDWAEFLGQVYFQRVAGIVWHNLRRLQVMENLHREVRRSLYMTFEAQKAWHDAFNRCNQEIIGALEDADCRYACLKGIVLSEDVYPPGIRTSNDVDLLVPPEDLTLCSKALEGAGYFQAVLEEGGIRPATRKEKLFARMSQYELIPFVKQIELPFMDIHCVDINFSLELHASQSTRLSVGELLDPPSYFNVGALKGRTLSREMFLIHLCLHFYKEATVLQWIEGSRDLGLYKLVDMHEFVQRYRDEIDWELLVRSANKYGLVREVYYGLHMTEQLFPGFMCGEVMAELRPDDVSYLDEYTDGRKDNPRTYRWKQSFLERVFDVCRDEIRKQHGMRAEYFRIRDTLSDE